MGARRPAWRVAVAGSLLPSAVLVALTPDVIVSTSALPAHIAGRFRDARGFQQAASGQYFVFDRRGHTVYGTDVAQTSVWEIVQLGAEEGRIIDPSAFSVAPNGTFAVADAPGNRERVQVFTPVGFRIGGFTLPGNGRLRITYGDVILGGISSLQYTGSSILISRPENGALITEYSVSGQPTRTFGALRRTEQEGNREVHLALNSGIPLVDPSGGFWFVFQAGMPVFQRYGPNGQLWFERHIEGRELEQAIAAMPNTWARPASGGEMPLVTPMVRAAAVDSHGNLWISFLAPYTYVFDQDGDKIRVVQFRGAGLVSPTSLFFGPRGTLLVTPGLLEFAVGADGSGRAGRPDGSHGSP